MATPNAHLLPSELVRLVREITGETPAPVGASFNLHYATAHSFLKVTRPWVKQERFFTEVATARHLEAQGLPVAHSLTQEPVSFEDEAGRTRWVTLWERLTPAQSLSPSEGTRLAAEWIAKLWRMAPPPSASRFQLGDFLHAAHVRLDGSPHPLAPRILEAVAAVVEELPTLPSVPYGFIHGDLHNDNLLPTARGVVLVDWESACVGPLEWDAAQNLRYTEPSVRPAQEAYWRTTDAHPELVTFYRRVRSLSSLSHLVASELTPPIYYRCLEDLGWA